MSNILPGSRSFFKPTPFVVCPQGHSSMGILPMLLNALRRHYKQVGFDRTAGRG
ncbi:MAG: hypothetical protein NTZ17_16840 [Phycisphaerae bacterium]|nr:hypothetical protein [Phycisphaerae bacterium]